ncbi:DUF3299 domain-containing protein [Pseudomonas flexibilis]|uniref:Lipoprotein n=1 Tax=Pseudomonas flexibilis TaxID=706570 RepID=A0A0B3BLL1_9PSED|nr:DUF3299 domain-containing protein [Pseudomonas flexibilis]KHO63510.1 lipoprotein [Pseudomonas flexibilis]SCY54832.1 hypothetical protein SAMN02927929_03255 [Pseudomonas flexibilis]
MLRRLLVLLFVVSLPLQAAQVRVLGWNDLVPADAPPPVFPELPMHDLAELGDVLMGEAEATTSMPQATGQPVVQALDGQRVRLPGYIVPLDMNERGRVTEFLLVPFYGACIHVPPPPSNQIVHAVSELGVPIQELWQPFWIEGPMQVEAVSSELAEAGYRIQAQKIYAYEEGDL